MKHTYLKLSMQSIPFGSSLEYTKQLNAARNCSPQGPCAIPPRQGQSQFISPVSSLNAPCCEASSSCSEGVSGPSCEGAVSGIAVVVAGVWGRGEFDGRVVSEDIDEDTFRRDEDIDSIVGREVSPSSLGCASESRII